MNGRIRSFNYDSNTGRQLSNQDYSICVRMERNFCSIQYTVCPDISGTNRSRSFSLSGNSNTAVMSMIGGTKSIFLMAKMLDKILIKCIFVSQEGWQDSQIRVLMIG